MKDMFHLKPEALRAQLPGTNGERFVIGAERGELSVELYEPRLIDGQKPHSRDECYVVIAGSGVFIAGESRTDFKAGDFLFVAAGIEHRFVDFSADLSVWVIFYGPEGGGDV